ncbi:hypothetical protein AGLY_003585 [Aphis glycines]|uniref:Uncharacterized protein n=1 Tax=Aphis glycines TaxID=307491 RepID=A0A6G0U137_APHGL|nr:hypothetical protein AGLY_003585 [Aphis glycines]
MATQLFDKFGIERHGRSAKSPRLLPSWKLNGTGFCKSKISRLVNTDRVSISTTTAGSVIAAHADELHGSCIGAATHSIFFSLSNSNATSFCDKFCIEPVGRPAKSPRSFPSCESIGPELSSPKICPSVNIDGVWISLISFSWSAIVFLLDVVIISGVEKFERFVGEPDKSLSSETCAAELESDIVCRLLSVFGKMNSSNKSKQVTRYAIPKLFVFINFNHEPIILTLRVNLNQKEVIICNYLDTTYIKYDVTFPPNIWVTQKVILKRTDDCEYLHDKFGDLFTSVHPKISVFMKNVLAMQTDSYVQMNAVDNNETDPADFVLLTSCFALRCPLKMPILYDLDFVQYVI